MDIKYCLIFTFFVSVAPDLINGGATCGYPGAPAHSSLTFSAPKLVPGVVATYACDHGFELLGPARRACNEEGKWSPEGIPFCVLNVAAGKAPMQSSVAGTGVPQKAVDGLATNTFNPNTCTMTQQERAPWWYVNLLEPYMVQLVRLDFGKACCRDGQMANIVVRVGNNRPDLGVNPVCNKFTGKIEEGKPLFLPCNPPIAGAFVSVQLEGPPENALSICEAFVYTDQALPIERCPQFRDQPPGSTATYNGKCYIFYSRQSLRFEEAQRFCSSRGGSLVDESNPALQGFLSWEMWRRHRSDPSAQYWLGAYRASPESNNWKWLNGKDVSVSFWNLPAGTGNCARFDGARGWLWSDTNCNDQLNFICQHGPRGCGRPEQPPNSTLLATSLDVGARIEHRCDPGHLLVGPAIRTCKPNGFYSDYPPNCRYLECGPPAQVPNGRYTLVNGTRSYQAMVRYACDEGHVMVGRNDLMCDIDQKWNGPPPRCEPLICPEPPQILNGYFARAATSDPNVHIVQYACDDGFQLVGSDTLRCSDGVYDQPPPACKEMTSGSEPISSDMDQTPHSSTKPTSTLLRLNATNAHSNNHEVPVDSEGGAFEEEYEPQEESDVPEEDHYATEDGQAHEHDQYEVEQPGLGTYDESDKHDTAIEQHEPSSSTKRSTTSSTSTIISSSSSNGPTSPKPNLKDDSDDNGLSDIDHNHIAEESVINVAKAVPGPGGRPSRENTAGFQSNLSGFITLGVFLGVIALAALSLTIVLLIRRKNTKGKHDRHRNSPDSHTITSVDSGSDAGLGRLYRRAWDSLAATGSPTMTTASIATGTTRTQRHKDTLDYRSRLSSVEGMRDNGEIIVHDALPRKHHHHHGNHHHHHHHYKPADGVNDWSRSIRSHASRH